MASSACSTGNNTMTRLTRAYRASVLHSLGDPTVVGLEASCEYFKDGLLVIQDGKVKTVGHADALLRTLPSDVEVIRYHEVLIVPGFIDTHIHFPQLDAIASYGEQLLDWLNNYIYPAEGRFSDKAHASLALEEDRIGSFAPGKEADFIVLDYKATPLLDYRLQQTNSIEEKLFVLMMLGDDRAIEETFAAGQSVHRRCRS